VTRAAVYGSQTWRNWKHDHHWSSTGDPLGAGNTALIGALGGRSAVLAFYDTRVGVTPSGATITAWNDVSGVGTYGPAMALSGTAPGWDSTNLLITCNANTGFLQTATSSLFDLSTAKTLVVVGTAAVGSGAALVDINDGSNARGMLITPANTTAFWAEWFPGSTLKSSTVTNSSRRIVFAALSGTTGFVEAPTVAQQTTTITAGASGSNHLRVLPLNSANTNTAISVRAVLVLAGLYTTAQRDTLKNWATTYHSAVLA